MIIYSKLYKFTFLGRFNEIEQLMPTNAAFCTFISKNKWILRSLKRFRMIYSCFKCFAFLSKYEIKHHKG